MDVERAIRTRRTHKAFAPEPVDAATITELLDLARWAPNHHLTNPWRFRVLGPGALARLKQASGAEAAPKLDRAPTLIAVSVVRDADAEVAREDRDATAVAVYIVLLAAHGRGLAGYWRTPGVLRTPEGRAALGVPDEEDTVGLLHLGTARQEQRVPERKATGDVVSWLD